MDGNVRIFSILKASLQLCFGLDLQIHTSIAFFYIMWIFFSFLYCIGAASLNTVASPYFRSELKNACYVINKASVLQINSW